MFSSSDIQVGWMYGAVTEDMLTGFKMHCRGWRSVRVLCPCTRLHLKDLCPQIFLLVCIKSSTWPLQVSMEIFFSGYCPLWYGYRGGLKWFQRISYINAITYPWTSIPLTAYCTLPAVCALVTGKFIIPEVHQISSLYIANVS